MSLSGEQGAMWAHEIDVCRHKIWMLSAFRIEHFPKCLINAKFCENTKPKITENWFLLFLKISWKHHNYFWTAPWLLKSKSCHWFQCEQKQVSNCERRPWNSNCPDEVSTVQVFLLPDSKCPKREDLSWCAAWEQNESGGKMKVKWFLQVQPVKD